MSDHLQKEITLPWHDQFTRLRLGPRGRRLRQAFIRTLKENLLWVCDFQTIEELRQAANEFMETYNTNWPFERLGFVSPAAFRRGCVKRPPRSGERHHFHGGIIANRLRDFQIESVEVLAEAVEFAQMPFDGRPFVVGHLLAAEPAPAEMAEQVGVRTRGGIKCACRIACTSFLARVRWRTT